MATTILHKIQTHLQLGYFTVIINETTDLSNAEQVVLVFRWVDSELSVHEEFLGLYKQEERERD